MSATNCLSQFETTYHRAKGGLVGDPVGSDEGYKLKKFTFFCRNHVQ